VLLENLDLLANATVVNDAITLIKVKSSSGNSRVNKVTSSQQQLREEQYELTNKVF
jgi:hypothetical protein